jgi:hypothetical protein
MDAIIETLSPILPEDVIRTITSYLIMKIPKNDLRYRLLDRHLSISQCRKREHFYSDGKFLGCLITFSNGDILLKRVLPATFVTYTYQNIITNESNSVRGWLFLTDKYNTRNANHYWDQWVNHQWVPNPNGY